MTWAKLIAADLSFGDSHEVLVNGDKVFPAMLEAIERARKRINFETYVYEKGQVADQFTAALEKAAGRGVQVNVVIDSIGASKMDKEHVERLRDAGCKVVDFNPSRIGE